MDEFLLAQEYLFLHLPAFKRGRLVDGHHRWSVLALMAQDSVRKFESMGWQFEPDVQEMDAWLSLL